MLSISVYKKSIFFASTFLFAMLPFGAVRAWSDLDSAWSAHGNAARFAYSPPDLGAMGDFAIFLVYMTVYLIGAMGIIMIFVGYLKMYLASGNEDNEDKGHHGLVTGFVSLIISVAVFFSLDSAIELLRTLASNLA